MNLIAVFVFLWILIIAGVGVAVWMARRKGGVLVTGYDNSDDSMGTKRLTPKDGQIIWSRGGREVCQFPLDNAYAKWDPFYKAPHYLADVTPGQGRVVGWNTEGVPENDKRLEQPRRLSEWLPMPGDRLLVVAGAAHVREINRSNSKSWEKLAVIAVVGIGIVLVLAVVGIVFTVKVWRSTGVS